MKRLVFPAVFAAGFVAAGVSAGVVVADATTTSATTTAPATTATTPFPTTTTTTTTTPAHRAVIPVGVRVAGVKVGGLAPADAVAAVQAAFDRPLHVVVNRTTLTITPRDYAYAWVPTAVARARIATPGTNQHLVVSVEGGPLRAWAKAVARRFSRPAVDASFAFRNGRPRVTKEQSGRSLDARVLTARVIAALQANSRLTIRTRSA